MEMEYRETRLDNGIRIVSSRLPHVGSIAMGIWVGIGGRYEPKRISGVSHFIEHLLFKGTERRSARMISQAIEGRGGYFNAFTQEETTCYYARVSARHIRNVVDILLDMYRAPRFAERDIRQERGVIVEEIMMYQDQPQHIAQETLGMLLWRGHPLGRPLAGSPGNVMQMARDDILQFKQRNYVPCNTLISFAGYLDHEHCVHLVHERLGGISAGRRSSFRKVSGKTKQEQMAVVRKNIEQAHLALGFRIFGRRDPRRYAMKLLSVILGENMSSRLFQEVREKHGMAYSIHSSVHLFGDTGVFSISAGLDRRRALKAWRLIVRALKRFKEKPVSKAELRRAKDYAGGQLAIGLESTTSQMIWMGEYLMGYGRFMQPADAVRQLEQVSVEDLQTAARELIRLDNLSMAWVIPEDMEDIEPDVLAAAETL